MDVPKDLHICGICKKIFNNIEYFIEHKTTCFLHQNNSALSPNTQDIQEENGLFCSETVLDLSVLETGSFPLLLSYDNEEVVTDENTFTLEEEICTEGLVNKSTTPNKIVDDINEEDIATLLATQLSKEVINSNLILHRSQQAAGSSEELSNTEELDGTQSLEDENEPIREIVKESSLNKKQKNACNICSFETIYHRDFVRHMRKHTGERPFVCCVCNKSFARQDKLATHKRIHSGDKKYKCHLCEYATTDSGALRKHLRIHTNERPHKCQMCSYTARNSSHMTVHLRTHTGDSPFFCQLESCGRTFKTSTDLKRHMKVHKLSSLSPTYSSFGDMPEKISCKHLLKDEKLSSKSLSCYVCQDFTRKGIRRKKQARRGVRALCVKAHECPFCSAAFVRQDSLRSHLKQHQQGTSHPEESLIDIDFDGVEAGKENNSIRSESPEADLPHDTVAKGGPVLYVGNTDCLQDSLISLDQDCTVHYIESSFL